MPGSLHQCLPTVRLPHGQGAALGLLAWAASAQGSVTASDQGKLLPRKSPAKPGALGRVFSSGFVHFTELHGAAATHIRRAALGRSCGV